MWVASPWTPRPIQALYSLLLALGTLSGPSQGDTNLGQTLGNKRWPSLNHQTQLLQKKVTLLTHFMANFTYKMHILLIICQFTDIMPILLIICQFTYIMPILLILCLLYLYHANSTYIMPIYWYYAYFTYNMPIYLYNAYFICIMPIYVYYANLLILCQFTYIMPIYLYYAYFTFTYIMPSLLMLCQDYLSYVNCINWTYSMSILLILCQVSHVELSFFAYSFNLC